MGKLCMEKQLLQLVLFLNVGFSFISCQTSTSLPVAGDNVASLSVSSTIGSSSYRDVLSESLVQTTLPELQTSSDVQGTEASFQVTTVENSISQLKSNGISRINSESKFSSTLNDELRSQSVFSSSLDSNNMTSSMLSRLPLEQTTILVASVPLMSTLSIMNSLSILDSINPSSSNFSQGIGALDPSITLSTSVDGLAKPNVSEYLSEISEISSFPLMEETSTSSESISTTSEIQDTLNTSISTPAFSSLTVRMSDMSSQSNFIAENSTLATESFVTEKYGLGIDPPSSFLLSTTTLDLMPSSTLSILSSTESTSNVIIPDPTLSSIDMTSALSSQSESLMQSDTLPSFFSSDSVFSSIVSTRDNIFPTGVTSMDSSFRQSIDHSSIISSDDLLTSSESSVYFPISSMSVSEYSEVEQSLTNTPSSVALTSVLDESYSESFTVTDTPMGGTTKNSELERTSSLQDVSITLRSSSSSETIIAPSSMQSFPLPSSSVVVEGPQKHNSGGLTSGEKAAIGICIPIVIIVCLAGLIYYLYRRKYHVASWKLSDVVSYRPWSYGNASYHDDESALIIPSL